MKDELDRILSRQEELAPSSGFTKSVMDRVRTEAAAPAPIPFPWARALPGLILCILPVVAICMTILRTESERIDPPGPSSLTAIWTGIFSNLWSGMGWLLRVANVGGLAWIVLALLLTLASVTLSMRLTARRI